MPEYDLTGGFPEDDELFLSPEQELRAHGFGNAELPEISDEESEALDRAMRDIGIGAGSPALAQSSKEALDAEIAQMLGEKVVGPLLLETIESLEDEWGAAMAMLDEPTNPLTPPDDPPDIAVPA